ncbi:hypothetical protein C9374_009892 [Naegleria lovaniensis]|uniref:Phosphatidylinositol-glycan biosynthesis class X protein n=1 Tax=Naegleria lovaniensis TaxID=51637 RepID=A0AA88GIM2_NAELO|nr:uncharacterized protein C9374_009892 [Naegleria lovaniensis]KAG2375269.1 hypothetical protein C9374_009892 [Naegleria lovaniensis]
MSFKMFSLILILFVCAVKSDQTAVYLKRREITKEGGFHRTIRTEFVVTTNSYSFKLLNVSYVEELSSDVYIDIYEMKNIKPDILLLKDQEYINVETPSYYSTEYNVTLSKIISDIKHQDEHHLVVTFEFPLHLRYQKPSNEESLRAVKIKNPNIFYMNNIEYKIMMDENSDISSLNDVWIPVGNLNDFHLVRYVTLVITILACILVCVLSFRENGK